MEEIGLVAVTIVTENVQIYIYIYIPPNEFLTPINSKRLIKPRNLKDFKTTNIVTDHARNNSQTYRVDLTKTVVYRYSFPPRTAIDWNNLEQEAVSSKRLESFKTQISCCP